MRSAFVIVLVLAASCSARPIWHDPAVFRVWTIDRLSVCHENPDDAPMPTTVAVAVAPYYAVAPLGGTAWLALDPNADPRVTLYDGEWRAGEIVDIDREEGFVLIRLDESVLSTPFAPPETKFVYRSIAVDWEDGRHVFQFDESGRLIRIVTDGPSTLEAAVIPILADAYFASWGRHAEPKPDWK